MIQLNETQVKELEAYLLEVPAKYANPILGFLGKLAQEQNPQQVQETTEA
jgi:hypothetical protein